MTASFRRDKPGGSRARRLAKICRSPTWLLLPGPVFSLFGLSFPEKGRIHACGIHGQTVVVWDVRTGKTLSETDGHHYAVRRLQFSRDQQQVTSVDEGGSICLWDRATGNLVRALPADDINKPGTTRCCPRAVSPDGKYAVAMYGDEGCLWNLDTGRAECTFPMLHVSLDGATFSADSKKLVVVARDASASVLDVPSGKVLQRFQLFDAKNLRGLLRRRGSPGPDFAHVLVEDLVQFGGNRQFRKAVSRSVVTRI